MASFMDFSESFDWNYITENRILLILTSITAFLVFKLLYKVQTRKLPPGPIGIPFFGYVPFLGKEPHKTLKKLSKKYGDIISLRMGPRLTIVLNEYSVMKEALSNTAALDRPPVLFEFLQEVGFGAANGEEWQEQRRFCMHSMRDLGLGRGPWQDTVMEEVASFMDKLESYGGKPVDITTLMNTALCNNILSLLVGRKFEDKKEDDKINTLLETGEVALTYLGPSLITTLIPGLRKLFEYYGISGHNRAAKIISKFCSIIREEIKKHQLIPEIRKSTDFVNLYLDKKENVATKNNKNYFTDKNLEGNVKSLFLGGSDTTMSSMGWLFRLMAEHQDVQKKVQRELDEVIGKDGRAYYEERFKIPYTFAVIQEAQRYSSIVPISTTRAVVSDFTLRGYTIPKGVDMFANLWALHHDPNYWEEPEKFNPERFLTPDSKLIINKPSFAPFSVGKRNCPGETVALMEILVFFASMMQRFTITAPPGEKVKFEVVLGLVSHLKPQPLCFVKRTDKD